MNETFAPYRRRIDCASEPAFALGRLHVSPATLEIRSNSGTETLEPRVMQVLVALWRRVGEAVTRDELSQLCWGGIVVGDDALNRSISRLRKAIAGEPAAGIDTIPKVGYRLRIEAPEAARRTVPGRVPRWLAIGFAIALVVVAAVLFLPTRGAAWRADGMRPLTREAGVESYPALSPNGEWLAYAAGPGFGGFRDIRLQGIGVGESSPLSLTATPGADELAPAWSPDGRRLAFVRRVPGEPCRLIVTTPPLSAERLVGRCRSDESTTIDWLGDATLVIADRDAPLMPRRLYAVQLSSGARQALTDPSAAATGDADATVSPDGRYIAFRRTAALGADDVEVRDREDGTVRAVTRDGFKAAGLAWSSDSRTLFISTNRGGDFGLWAVPASGGEPPRRVSLGLSAFSQISADRHGRLAVQLSKSRANLVALGADGVETALTVGNGIDWDPAVAPDGSIAYVSDLSGAAELWVKRPGKAPARLTSLRGSYLHSPRWSPDGRLVAFIAVAAQKSDVHVVGIDGGGLRRVTRDGAAKGSVIWDGDGALLFTRRTERGWALVRQTASGPQELAAARDAVVLRRAPEGGIYIRRASDPHIALLDGERLRATAIEVEDREAWEVGADGIYAVRGAGTSQASVWLSPWFAAARPVAKIGSASRPNFAVRRDGALVMPRLKQDEADLMLLELSRE